MCNTPNLVLDNMFHRCKIRKHDQELKNKHGNNQTNDQNDNIFTTKSEEKVLILNEGSVHVPVIIKYSYRSNSSTEHFHVSTKIHSMFHHTIKRSKKYVVHVFEERKLNFRVSYCQNYGLFLCTQNLMM